MKKSHDLALREIHELVITKVNDIPRTTKTDIHMILLASSALRASHYVNGFKNLQHLHEVATNGGQENLSDAIMLTRQAHFLMTNRSIKQLNIPGAYYKLVVSTLDELDKCLLNNELIKAKLLLEDSLEESVDTFGYRASNKKVDEYKANNPVLKKYFETHVFFNGDKTTPEEQVELDKYYKYMKSLRFNLYYRYNGILNALLELLEKILREANYGTE